MPSAQSTATPGGVLRKNVAWAFSGNAVFTLSQAAILPIVAKIGSVAMVGQYALGLAIVTPITLLTRLQLRAILVTDIRDEHGFPDYLGVRLCTNVLALAIVAVLVMAGGYPGETSAIIFLVALVKFLESASDLLFGLLQRYDRWDIISASTVSKGLVSLLLLGSVMWQTGSLVAGLGAMAAWFAVVLVAYEVPFVRVFLSQRGKSARPTLRAGVLWKLTRLALPMGLVATLLSIINNVPRYVVEVELGEDALGYFACLLQLAMAAAVPLQALGQAVVTRLALYSRTDPERFAHLVLLLVSAAASLGIAGTMGAALFGKQILEFVYRPEYAVHHEALVWLSVGATFLFTASALGYVLTGLRLFRAQVPLYALTGIVCLLSLLWFVPAYGLMGAAYASIASWSTATAGSVVILVLHRQGQRSKTALRPSQPAPSYLTPGNG